VLVVVLVTLAFAALLLTRMIETGAPDLLIAMREADRTRLRTDAYGALETTLAALMDFRTVDGGLYSPSQGWSDILTYAEYQPREGVTMTVTFEDESAKLSLPRMNADTLSLLFVQLGLTTQEAARVADALLTWTRNGHVSAETATSAVVYGQGDPPAQPPLRSLRSFDELAAIAVARDYFFEEDGKPKPLLDAFKQAVSLYEFNATNLNSASEAVLVASGWDTTQSSTLQKYLTTKQSVLKQRPYLRSAAEARGQVGNVSMRNLGAQIQLLRVIVTAQQGGARLQLSALVTWPGQAKMPTPPATTTAQTAPAQSASRPAPAPTPQQSNGANSLRYPFTVLELSENALPAPVPPPDAPAA
jgi:general secretion pathway protein K